MDELSFKLEIFEGPLDLLLSLIEKHKINICDIEISLLLEQYMAYIDKAREYNIELAADFLEMASTLLYIKSCSLLPKEEVPEEDPKAELEQRLQEYARCKKAAEMLSENSMYGKVYFRESLHEELPKPQANYSYSPLALMNAYNSALRRIEGQKPLSSKHFNGIIGTEFISVASRVIHLLRLLINNARVSFTSVFKNSTSRSQTIATFLAVLELIRSGRVDIPDNNNDPENFDIVLVDNRPNRRKSS